MILCIIYAVVGIAVAAFAYSGAKQEQETVSVKDIAGIVALGILWLPAAMLVVVALTWWGIVGD